MRRPRRGTDISNDMIATPRTATHRYHHQRAVRGFIEFIAMAAVALAITLALVGGVVGRATSGLSCTARSLANATHSCEQPR